MGNIVTSNQMPLSHKQDAIRWFEGWRGTQPNDYERICRTQKSDSPWEQAVPFAEFGRMEVKNETSMVDWDIPSQGIPEVANNLWYAKGFQYTLPARIYDKNLRLLQRLSQSLRKCGEESKRYLFWSMFVDAFTSTRGDGKALCATDHPLTGSSATLANKPSVDLPLSVTAVSDARITMRRWVDGQGNRMDVLPYMLVYEPANHDEAYVMMQSDGQVGSSNNDPNPIKGTKYFPGGGIETPYISSPDDWFIITSENDMVGFVWNEVLALTFGNEQAASFLIERFFAYMAGSFMCESHTAIYGSSGVS